MIESACEFMYGLGTANRNQSIQFVRDRLHLLSRDAMIQVVECLNPDFFPVEHRCDVFALIPAELPSREFCMGRFYQAILKEQKLKIAQEFVERFMSQIG